MFQSLFIQEIQKLRMLFQKYAYPNWFINKIITKFEDRNFNYTNDCNLSKTQEMEKKFIYILLTTLVNKDERSKTNQLLIGIELKIIDTIQKLFVRFEHISLRNVRFYNFI